MSWRDNNNLKLHIEDKVFYSPDGCWYWTGSVYTNGYGRIRALRSKEGKRRLVHRVYYELVIGPIPNGLFICHRCDNRLCINPDHLFLGTAGDNVRDCVAKGRLTQYDKRGERHPQAVLTNKMVVAIRAKYIAGGVLQRQLAKEYGVKQGQISRVIRKEGWPHVD